MLQYYDLYTPHVLEKVRRKWVAYTLRYMEELRPHTSNAHLVEIMKEGLT